MGWIFSEYCESAARLDGKTVVITGCNSGIGKETAAELYKRGANVVMACRNLEKAAMAEAEIVNACNNGRNGTISIKKLDLLSFKSIRAFVKNILETTSEIHTLVNNAGMVHLGRDVMSEDGFEINFAVNYLGHFLLTLLLLPRLLKSAPARIINLSSCTHRFANCVDWENINATQGFNSYARSKLAIAIFSRELSERLAGTGVTTYAVDPGIVDTEITRYSYHVWYILSKILLKVFCKTAYQGAQTTLHCALDEKCGQESGHYYRECALCDPSPVVFDKFEGKKLWEESVKLVKLLEFNPFAPETVTDL